TPWKSGTQNHVEPRSAQLRILARIHFGMSEAPPFFCVAASPSAPAAGVSAGACFGASVGTSLGVLPDAPGVVAGTSAGAAGAGCPWPPVGTLSITLVGASGRVLTSSARPSVEAKNTAARTPVVRDRKLAEPVAPNRLPEAPPPKAAPMSA